MMGFFYIYLLMTTLVVMFNIFNQADVTKIEVGSLIIFWPLYIIKYTIKALWIVITKW